MMLSFDRMKAVELTEEAFKIDKKFNAEAYFAEYFGVMIDERIPLQRIVLRAYGNERFALKDLPIHHSQKLIEETEDYIDYEIKIRPTGDFLAHLLSRGRWLRVIEPEEIAQDVENLHVEAVKN